MPVTENKETGTLQYDVWWKTGGGGMVNRDYLDADHPQQTYNYLQENGVIPENYGIMHPMSMEYENHTREQLLSEVIRLRRELNVVLSSGF